MSPTGTPTPNTHYVIDGDSHSPAFDSMEAAARWSQVTKGYKEAVASCACDRPADHGTDETAPRSRYEGTFTITTESPFQDGTKKITVTGYTYERMQTLLPIIAAKMNVDASPRYFTEQHLYNCISGDADIEWLHNGLRCHIFYEHPTA